MYQIKHMGRLPPFHDPRDYSPQEAGNILKTTSLPDIARELPEKNEDNYNYLPEVYDQEDLGSCVAFATDNGLEYISKLLFGRSPIFSKLYTYKMGRDLAFGTGSQGDTGLWIKHGIGTVRRHGAVEESRYPYITEDYDLYPQAHIHGYADDYRALKYFRLDYPNVSIEKRKERINTYINNKFPVIVGFYVFESADMEGFAGGEFPYPAENEDMLGGHATMIYGYDDNKVIINPFDESESKGAWKFRNSWGSGWGDNGDGWLPYDYLLKPQAEFILADEFYTITRMDWLDLWDFE
jgi:C1A family cysteine protease